MCSSLPGVLGLRGAGPKRPDPRHMGVWCSRCSVWCSQPLPRQRHALTWAATPLQAHPQTLRKLDTSETHQAVCLHCRLRCCLWRGALRRQLRRAGQPAAGPYCRSRQQGGNIQQRTVGLAGTVARHCPSTAAHLQAVHCFDLPCNRCSLVCGAPPGAAGPVVGGAKAAGPPLLLPGVSPASSASTSAASLSP